tara:strand:- start:767 stop:1189 length:423 start_codon:yes stop_codon:yes gene_type:complete
MAKNKDSNEGFHIIDKSKKSKEPKRVEVIYTVSGKHDYLEDKKYPAVKLDSTEAKESAIAHAMKITIGARTKYYAKRGKHGRLFNPVGMFSEGMGSKRLHHAGRPEWRFVEIGERAFRFYRDFLRTKNIAYLHNAERELL